MSWHIADKKSFIRKRKDTGVGYPVGKVIEKGNFVPKQYRENKTKRFTMRE